MPRTPTPAPIRRRDDAPGGREEWTTSLGRLVQGDAPAVLRAFRNETYELAFADPPFNLGKDYGGNVNDRRSQEEYLVWCHAWLDELVRLLKPGGALFLYNLPRWNVHLAAFLETRMTFRNWIAVEMRSSFPIAGRLYPAHYSLLYFTKGSRALRFNPPRLPMVTCRRCGAEVKDYGGYKEKLDPTGFNLSDVWSDLSPVRHPRYKTPNRPMNQLPLKMLDRILDIATEPGDRVLDPFAGSGTTLVAAELKGRRWTGIEIESLAPIVSRLQDLEPDRAHLEDIGRAKNRLFTDETLSLRRRHHIKLGKYRVLIEQEPLVGDQIAIDDLL
jgi:site-specific DNA-methyltransferase (adenine-specific)